MFKQEKSMNFLPDWEHINNLETERLGTNTALDDTDSIKKRFVGVRLL